jgi:hypothetical protein
MRSANLPGSSAIKSDHRLPALCDLCVRSAAMALAVQGPINNIVPVTVGLFGRLVARGYLV